MFYLREKYLKKNNTTAFSKKEIYKGGKQILSLPDLLTVSDIIHYAAKG